MKLWKSLAAAYQKNLVPFLCDSHILSLTLHRNVKVSDFAF